MPEDQMPYRTADTRDLIAVHRAIGRVAGYLTAMTPSVAVGDLRAAGTIADLAAELGDAVTRLDAAECELLWPVLRGYLVAVDACSAADDVLVVQAQGERLVALVGELASIAARFRATADASDRAALVDLLPAVHTAVEQHFAAVEHTVLPLAGQYMTDAQWHEIGRHFLLGVSLQRREFRTGAMLLECDRRDRSRVLRSSGARRSRFAMARARRSYLRECDRIQHVLGGRPAPVTLVGAS
jgi:hypothetical protein